MVANSFLSFVPSIGSLPEHMVIGKAGTSEGLGKVSSLFGCWVKPESKCLLDIHNHTINPNCVKVKSAIPPTPKGIGFLARFL